MRVGAPGADDGTHANDINNLEEALLTGYSKDGSGQNYIWRAGIFTPLPGFPDPKAVATYAYSLNERRDYCGRWYDSDGTGYAFAALRKKVDL